MAEHWMLFSLYNTIEYDWMQLKILFEIEKQRNNYNS